MNKTMNLEQTLSKIRELEAEINKLYKVGEAFYNSSYSEYLKILDRYLNEEISEVVYKTLILDVDKDTGNILSSIKEVHKCDELFPNLFKYDPISVSEFDDKFSKLYSSFIRQSDEDIDRAKKENLSDEAREVLGKYYRLHDDRLIKVIGFHEEEQIISLTVSIVDYENENYPGVEYKDLLRYNIEMLNNLQLAKEITESEFFSEYNKMFSFLRDNK